VVASESQVIYQYIEERKEIMPVDRLVEKLQIFVSASDLPNVQMFNKTDAFAAVMVKDPWTHEWSTVAVTEVIRDNHDPTWTTTCFVDYFFETVQEVMVRVYQQGDMTAALTTLGLHTMIGEVKFLLSNLMRNSQRLSLALTASDGSEGKGLVAIKAEAVVDSRDVFCVSFQGHKLVNKDGFFNTSDPQYTISRLNEDGTYTLVHRSEKIDNNLNPKWKVCCVFVCESTVHYMTSLGGENPYGHSLQW
jgi:copine 5/8/9